MKYDNTDSNSTLKHICNIQTKLYNTNWALNNLDKSIMKQ